MSGLAKSFQKAIKRELGTNAAWLPVSNTLKIGDYGFFEDGVFRSIGNITDKYPGIELKIAIGSPTKINFTSEGTKTFKLDAGGNTTNSFEALGEANASLKFAFNKSDSVVVKASEVGVDQLQNIESVANVLASKSDWKNKFKVVSAAYTAKNCLIVCAREAGTEFAINANANILKEIDAGKVNGSIETTSSNNSTFESIGETGVIAIRLFKLNIFNQLRMRGPASTASVEIQEIFDMDPEDDF
ncbi:hypothetical protein [Muriicola sp. Z0-33]|uniref:hypothetical protein n=1 Tax=Muriicola sp. Z0-33 TaxID=2816957 RepID=UPI0022384022|nr:hypothetical protein [Muriicola sp. Z0-33]MCW5516168.1 hypothetical protein [Muriicola sp. Z0-33]